MIIRLKAMDLLFFRNSKPFNKGENYWAESLLFPNLSTIYGAIRSAYFGQFPETLEKAKEIDDPTKDLHIVGIHYVYDNDVFYPLPYDLVYTDNYDWFDVNRHEIDNNYPLIKLECKEISNCYTNINTKYGISHFFINPKSGDNEKLKVLEYGVLDKYHFMDYLYNEQECDYYGRKLDKWVLEESKVGIARDDGTHSAQETMLYRIGQKRYDEKLEIEVEFEGIEIPECGFMKIGGQGNSVSYRVVNKRKNDVCTICIEDARYIKFYLESDTFFDNGWIPNGIDLDTLKGVFDNKEVKLIGACLGKPLTIGGFDLKKQKAKPQRRAVPAGSVYVFELINPTTEYSYKKLSLGLEQDQKQGYGSGYAIYYR